MSSGYTQPVKPVVRELLSLQSHGVFTEISPFRPIEDPAMRQTHSGYVKGQKYLDFDTYQLHTVANAKPSLLRVTVPGRTSNIILEVFHKDLFTTNYQLNTSEGPATPRTDMLFYRGIIQGNEASVAVVSIIGDEMYIMYADQAGNRRIHPTEGGRYVSYHDANLIIDQSYSCNVTDEYIEQSRPIDGLHHQTRMTGDCVEIYFECDQQSYVDNDSNVTDTEAWVAALFNEVSTIYDNENIPIGISEIFIWTTPDPYVNDNSASAALSTFVNEINNNGYNGRLAHLLSTRGLGGGIAFVDVLCSTSNPCAVSTSLSTNIDSFPTYSWNIQVITHELGHNFGSFHTHRCVWNSDNTQIDDCGNEWANDNGYNPEGSDCYDQNDPILPTGAGGTIMSYCHLISGIGVNFSNGFGQQPGDLIRSEFNNASCNTGSCGPPACTALLSPDPGEINVELSTNLLWQDIPSAIGYILNIGITPGGGQILNDLDVGDVITYDPDTFPADEEIFVEITPYNLAGNASGCITESFFTEPGGQPACTELIDPVNGATDVPQDADISWDHAVGNQSGYKIRMGTTPGGVDIANDVDVGNVTVYDPGQLPVASTIYTVIIPYGTQGDTTGCPEEDFATVTNMQYCESQSNISTGEWISMFSFGEFTNASGASQYTDYTSQMIDISLGETYLLSATPGFDNQAWNEYFRVWIDYNIDGDFDDPGELIMEVGPTTAAVNDTHTVPLTVGTGITTLRISMKYNDTPEPCEVFQYGEVEDYTVKIGCNVVVNNNDSGPGSLRFASGCVSPGDTVSFSDDLEGQTIQLTGNEIYLDNNIFLIADPLDSISVQALQSPRIFSIQPSSTALIEGLTFIGGTQPDGGVVTNEGILILRDVQVFRNSGLSSQTTVLNFGQLSLQGECIIHH